MPTLKPREERIPLALAARMVAGEGWSDVTVSNVSSRGMMLRCKSPPARNTYVEVRHRHCSFVGKVVWSKDGSCGIRTQDRIVISELLSCPSNQAQRGGVKRPSQRQGREYGRSHMRVLSPEESSKLFARAFDWSSVALAVAVGAMLLAKVAEDAFEPLREVEQVLAMERLD